MAQGPHSSCKPPISNRRPLSGPSLFPCSHVNAWVHGSSCVLLRGSSDWSDTSETDSAQCTLKRRRFADSVDRLRRRRPSAGGSGGFMRRPAVLASRRQVAMTNGANTSSGLPRSACKISILRFPIMSSRHRESCLSQLPFTARKTEPIHRKRTEEVRQQHRFH
jgi:hypothetical protein